MKRTGFKQRKRKCPQCKEWFMPFNSMQKCCANPKCALEQGKIDRSKRERIELKRRKEKIKSRSEWLREAQAAFNAYVRIRDQDLPCISCQRHHKGQYHAGHFRTVKAAPQLRFNLKNCHKQCMPCNAHLSGNITEYRINLVKRIGVDNVEWIECNQDEARYSIEYAKRLKRIFNKRTRLYKKLFRD